MEVYTVNAFAKVSGGGNGAGVVPFAEGLTEEQMLNIARQLGFSETAFVTPSEEADAIPSRPERADCGWSCGRTAPC